MPASDEREMDDLAELVGGGIALPAAARRLGMSPFRRDYLWARIVARLGRQAA
jgi:hypothetical protein